MADSPYVVEMKGIVKKFPGVLALDHVDFQLRPGEVHVLLGENGAGKSTLIKVLSGAYVADEGEIWVSGKRADIRSPQDSLDQGMRCIYQELNLVRPIDIARNIFLGIEPKRGGLVDSRQALLAGDRTPRALPHRPGPATTGQPPERYAAEDG